METVRRFQIVCGALAVSVVLINAVLTFLWLTRALPPKPLPQAGVLALFALALVLLVAAPAVKRAILKRTEAEFEGDRERWTASWINATLTAFTMREAAALLSFILALLSGNPWWSWGTGAGALLAMFVDRPRA